MINGQASIETDVRNLTSDYRNKASSAQYQADLRKLDQDQLSALAKEVQQTIAPNGYKLPQPH